jgi:hypothetical protein
LQFDSHHPAEVTIPLTLSELGNGGAKNFLVVVDPAVRRSTYFQRAVKIPVQQFNSRQKKEEKGNNGNKTNSRASTAAFASL